MSRSSVDEIVRRRREEYGQCGRREKGRIVDELVGLTQYHRKSLLRLLSKPGTAQEEKVDRRRGSRYAVVRPKLRELWEVSFYCCGKRLKPFLPELVRVMVRAEEIEVSPFEEELLMAISAATIDRLLAPYRRQLQPRGRTMTKPGTLLREQIPIRTFADWDVHGPGFFEVDLVAHCGGSGEGEFLYSVDLTDVFTGWTTMGVAKGKGQQGIVRAIDGACKHVPYPILGLDSDNGSEFINAHLVRYCEKRGITFTRSRPHKKNDQCHVEQKNWSLVRQFFGYYRLETDAQLALMQKIQPLVIRFHNFYQPMMRLLSKERNGSKVKRIYDEARTPYQRVTALDEGIVPSERRERLVALYEATGPKTLQASIQTLLTELRQTCHGEKDGRIKET